MMQQQPQVIQHLVYLDGVGAAFASVPLFSVGWVRSHREPLQVLARFEAECDRAIRPQQLPTIIIDGPAVTAA
jgi:hypothetical protein